MSGAKPRYARVHQREPQDQAEVDRRMRIKDAAEDRIFLDAFYFACRGVGRVLAEQPVEQRNDDERNQKGVMVVAEHLANDRPAHAEQGEQEAPAFQSGKHDFHHAPDASSHREAMRGDGMTYSSGAHIVWACRWLSRSLWLRKLGCRPPAI
ncbi:MAG: hypothetical protein ACTS6J_08115 [Burkholderiales bacterium]